MSAVAHPPAAPANIGVARAEAEASFTVTVGISALDGGAYYFANDRHPMGDQ